MEKEKQENILDRLGISFHRTLSFKLFTIGILVLLLLIPKIMILSLISERSNNADEAINEVMSKWSGNQEITGPVLTIPYKKRIYDEKDEEYDEVIHTATFLPKELNIDGKINPQKLYRSIYDVIVYQSDIILKGNFDHPDFSSLNIDEKDILWESAQIQLAINDLRGINEEVKLKWNNSETIFSPGLKKSVIGESGISVSLPNFSANNFPGNFQISLNLKGSRSLMFTSVGEKTNVNLKSPWNDPGFIGNFLPKEREINESGFSANWTILHFNRNFPQQWSDGGNNSGINNSEIHNSDFGVELVTLANHYQKNMRSAKYAVLIIIITFIVFFLYEVFSKQRIHPFQYIMVGGAITIFYLLLLSISEQLGFNHAYIIATSAVIILIFLYSRSFISKIKNSLGIALALGACYVFIFVLLQLESYALLAGSVGLFLLLAMLMFFTRKINWYKE